MNERLEIEGDMREEVRAELEQIREDAEVEAHYQDWKARNQEEVATIPESFWTEEDPGLPPGWENAPLSAQIAYLIAGDNPDEFDMIKAHLKGEL